jgi:phosphoserine aminotransferase
LRVNASTGQPYDRVFNFSAGPACLPIDVLEKAQADLLNWNGSGMSVMEMSHRGKEFDGIAKKAEADLRTLLSIPDNYKVLFLQGGASTQFAAIPLNLTQEGDTVDYIITGSWSKKAASEAKKYCNVNIAATVTTKPSRVLNSSPLPMLVTNFSLPTCPPISAPSLLTSLNSVSSMLEHKRTSDLQVALL